MHISVIIPTYNRRDRLLQTIASLTRQTLSPTAFEVIVVDDGGTDGTGEALSGLSVPFSLRYCWQENRGWLAARNLGARQANGDLLAFLDDDIVVVPEYLSELLECCRVYPTAPVAASLCPSPRVRRTTFGAIGHHEDTSSTSLEGACKLWRSAARSAVSLFAMFPEIERDLVLFRDMGYVSWRRNPPPIAMRKIARTVSIQPPVLRILEYLTSLAERACPSPVILRPLYRGVPGAHICIGYQEGLGDRHD